MKNGLETNGCYSNFSNSSNRARTTSLLVSSISPAKNTSSRIAYTCETNKDWKDGRWWFDECTNGVRKHNVLESIRLVISGIAYLVKVEYKIEFANILEECICMVRVQWERV
jgi:hypothetical protein